MRSRTELVRSSSESGAVPRPTVAQAWSMHSGPGYWTPAAESWLAAARRSARCSRWISQGFESGWQGVRVLVASDVDNPLLGPRGAAAVFGPQKGAGPAELRVLEDGLTRWARVVTAAVGRDFADHPGAGAAGGTGFAALALLGAELRPGIELILELLRFDEAVAGADLVVTGEGSLDEQSLAGKAPIGVAQAASRAGVGVVAVAGRNQLSHARLQTAGIQAAYPLADLEPDPARSIANAAVLLRQVGRIIAVEQLAS